MDLVSLALFVYDAIIESVVLSRKFRMSCRVSIAWILVAASPLNLFAQPAATTLLGEEKRVRDELELAAELVAKRRWDDAIRRYRQILTESGDLFVPVPNDQRRALPAHWLVHQRLSKLDPAALKLYREQVDAGAKQVFERARANRDVRGLNQVVVEAFCSRPAEQALHLLGDLALERGEFEAAERYWRLIAPPASFDDPNLRDGEPASFHLVYPDPADGGALARAKQILAQIFRGAKDEAKQELVVFAKKHVGASGFLAGRQENYAVILSKLLATDVRPGAGAVSATSLPWSTFAGDPSRNLQVPGDALPYWYDSPTWVARLPGDPKGKPHRDGDPPPGTASAARSLAFFPAISAGHVFVADAARVTAFNLRTGEIASTYNHGEKNQLPDSLDLRVPSRSDARYSLTISGDLIYARLGAQPMRPNTEPNKPQEMDSALVCLAMNRDNEGALKLRFRWQIRARLLDSESPALFEGAPVVRDGRLLVAKTRFEGRQAISSIECYDADAANYRDEPPPLRWKQDLWSAESATDSTRQRHDLLALAGPLIVYCTHSGAIVALDAESGRRAWAFRYRTNIPRAADGLLPRDLAPCLFANGHVYAAPADTDRIICLDAMTGEQIWESQPIQVVQLLGVSRGRLFATLGGFPRGIRCFDAAHGLPLWTRPDEGDLATYGRGFLSDRWIFWPTRNGLRVLSQDDGEPIDAGSNTLPWGNLTFGEGCLIVATPTEIWGFVPDRLRLGEWDREANRDPNNAIARYRLALALAEDGQHEAAVAEFRKLEGASDDFFLGSRVSDLARHRRFELVLHQAEREQRRDHPDVAKKLLQVAAGEPFAWPDRVRAASLFSRLDKSTLPDFLGHDELRSIWITPADGLPERADDFFVGQLNEAGRAMLERRAAERLQSDFDAAVREFPWTQAVRKGLREKAEHADNPAEAALRYRQLLAASHSANDPSSDDVLTARRGLMQYYDRLGYREAAAALGSQRPREPPPSAAPAPTELTSKLESTWTIELQPGRERPLRPIASANGDSVWSDDEGRCFFAVGRQIVCRSLLNGKTLWSADLKHSADCFALHTDTVVVAGPDGITRLRRSDGASLWTFLPADPEPMTTSLQLPFYRLNPIVPAATFSDVRLAGSRLFLLSGGNQLFALDVESGQPLWQRLAPGAPLSGITFRGHYLATNDHVLLQSSAGQILCLDANSGRLIFRRESTRIWRSDPLILESGRALIATDSERLAALQFATGKSVWEKQLAGWSSLSGALPQIRRDGSHFLALVERSYGFELERRSLATGEPDVKAILLGPEHVELDAAGLAAESYCVPRPESVTAYSRDDGKRIWETRLPIPASWQIMPTRSGLLVFPREPIPRSDTNAAQERAWSALAGVPTPERVHTAAAILYHAWMRRVYPVLLLDPSDGRILARRDLPARGRCAALLTGAKHAAIALDGTLLGLSR
jgi:outer membrane protein assembly factor BamB